MYKYIKTKSELEWVRFFEGLGRTMVISIDTESSSLDPLTSEWILLQIKLGEDIYIFDARTLEKKFLIYIIDLVNCSQKPVIFHNAKYDLKVIYKGTGVLINKVHDTMIVESLLYRGIGEVFYSLSYLVNLYAGEILDKDIRETFYDLKGDLSNEQLSYSALDVLYLDKIYNQQIIYLTDKKLIKTYDLEMELIPVLVMMELTGVYLDADEWRRLKDQAILDREESHKIILDVIMNKIDFKKYANGSVLADAFCIPVNTKKARLALESLVDPSVLEGWIRENININSYKQLLAVLNGLYRLNITSTNEKVLRDLKDKTIIPYILKYREYEKKITTYGEDFLKNIHPVTGRVHAEFLQNGTVSGRFSSINPNLQNIPAEEGYRKPFKAPDWKRLLSLDYSQQEYRLAGSTSKDPVIIDAYVKGKDMHTSTASIIFGKNLNDITKEERNFGKTINFAVLYGSTAYGLSFNLKIAEELAEQYLLNFQKGYPTLAQFKKCFEDEVWRLKYSTTMLGRKRYFERKEFFVDHKEAERYEARIRREGFNHLIQGTGADVTKLAMIKMFKENPFGDSFKLIIQIHDEIVVEVDEQIAKEAEEFGKKCMIDVFQPFLGDIPAAVESHLDTCWSK